MSIAGKKFLPCWKPLLNGWICFFFLFHPLKPSSNCYRSLFKTYVTKNFKSIIQKAYILSEQTLWTCGVRCSPSKSSYLRQQLKIPKIPSAAIKDQDRWMSAVSLRNMFSLVIVVFATHALYTVLWKAIYASLSFLQKSSFMMNFKCYTSNQKFTKWVKPLKHAS